MVGRDSGSRRPHDASPNEAWTCGAALAIAIAFIAIQTSRFLEAGVDALTYDELQYARRALETHDRVQTLGWTSWPWIVWSAQRHGKPPLLENLVALALLLLGRDALVAGLASVLALATAASLGLAFALLRASFSARAGLVGMLLLTASPAFARFTSSPYPTGLLVAAWTWTAWILFRPLPRWSRLRTLALGVGLGLGCLTQATFPALAAAPLGTWIVAGSASGLVARRRLNVALAAMLLGAAVAATWYGNNLGAALLYTSRAYRFETWQSAASTGSAWLTALFWNGFGVGGAAAIACTLARVLSAPRRTLARFGSAQIALLGACIATFLLLLVPALSSPNVSERLVLPGLIALLLATAAVLAEPGASGWRIVRNAALVVVAMQWGIVQVGRPLLSPTASPSTRALLDRLDPLGERQLISRELADRLLRHVEVVERSQPGVRWYLVVHDPEMSAPRLNLLGAAGGARKRFWWATHFNWPSARREQVLATSRDRRAIFVDLERAGSLQGRVLQRNLHADEVRTFLHAPENGFAPAGILADPSGRWTIRLYANFGLD
jgi:hypothetical protein